jgi:hypothetical protein
MNFKELFDRAVAANLAYIEWMPENASSGSAMWAQAVAARQLSPRWAEAFLSASTDREWTIPAAGIVPNDAGGFAAQVLQTESGKILCVRGTEVLPDVWPLLLPFGIGEQAAKDLFGADLAIATFGIAVQQAVSLANFVRRLEAPFGVEVPQCVVSPTGLSSLLLSALKADPMFSLLPDLTPIFAPSFSTATAPGLGLLAAGEKLEIVGHSLGGHLAAVHVHGPLFFSCTTCIDASIDAMQVVQKSQTIFLSKVAKVEVLVTSSFFSHPFPLLPLCASLLQPSSRPKSTPNGPERAFQ